MDNQQNLKICPYCHGIIGPRHAMVVCTACRIPHHRECWDENRGCTTYGCSGAPFRRPGRRWGAILQGLLGINFAVSLAGTISLFLMLVLFLQREGQPDWMVGGFSGDSDVLRYMIGMGCSVGLLAAATGLAWKAMDEGGGWPSLLACAIMTAISTGLLLSWMSFIPGVVFALSCSGTFVASKPQKLLLQT